MHIQLKFKDANGNDITQCEVYGDTAEQASEVINHVLLEVYAKHGPGVSIQQLPVLR